MRRVTFRERKKLNNPLPIHEDGGTMWIIITTYGDLRRFRRVDGAGTPSGFFHVTDGDFIGVIIRTKHQYGLMKPSFC